MEQNTFYRLSQAEKLTSIQKLFKKILKRKGWKIESLRQRRYPANEYYSKGKQVLFLFTTLSATKEFLKYHNAYNIGNGFKHKGKDSIFFYIPYVSLRKIPYNRIEDYYDSEKPIKTGEIIQLQSPLNLRDLNTLVDYPAKCHFISNQKSLHEYERKFLDHYRHIFDE